MKPYADLAQELFEIMDPQKRRPPHEDMSKMMRGELAVMHLLEKENGSLLAGEISKRLSMTTSRVAAVLGSLEKKAMIQRRNNPADKRCVSVLLTQEGRAFSCEKRENVKRSMQRMLEQLGEPDAQEYVRLTRRAFEIMDIHRKEEFNEEKPT